MEGIDRPRVAISAIYPEGVETESGCRAVLIGQRLVIAACGRQRIQRAGLTGLKRVRAIGLVLLKQSSIFGCGFLCRVARENIK